MKRRFGKLPTGRLFWFGGHVYRKKKYVGDSGEISVGEEIVDEDIRYFESADIIETVNPDRVKETLYGKFSSRVNKVV